MKMIEYTIRVPSYDLKSLDTDAALDAYLFRKFISAWTYLQAHIQEQKLDDLLVARWLSEGLDPASDTELHDELNSIRPA